MRDFMQSVFPLLIVRIMLYGVYFRIILTLLCLFSRLAVTFNDAAERAFQYLQNCNVLLKVKDNTFFEPYYGLSEDIVAFGKYRGKRLAEVYYIDPNYVLWLAH